MSTILDIFCPPLENEKATALRLGVTVACLRRWRRLGEGPAWVKLGRLVRYNPQDVEDFVQSSTRGVPEAA